MTLDQIWFRLCDLDVLQGTKPTKGVESNPRKDKMPVLAAAAGLSTDEEGYIKGRAADGTPMKAKIGGKSLARRLMEQEAERKRLEAMTPRERRAEQRKQRQLRREQKAKQRNQNGH